MALSFISPEAEYTSVIRRQKSSRTVQARPRLGIEDLLEFRERRPQCIDRSLVL